MNEMLSALTKFKKLDTKPGKKIISLSQQQNRLDKCLEKVKRVPVISYIKRFIQEVCSLVLLCMICLKSINH